MICVIISLGTVKRFPLTLYFYDVHDNLSGNCKITATHLVFHRRPLGSRSGSSHRTHVCNDWCTCHHCDRVQDHWDWCICLSSLIWVPPYYGLEHQPECHLHRSGYPWCSQWRNWADGQSQVKNLQHCNRVFVLQKRFMIISWLFTMTEYKDSVINVHLLLADWLLWTLPDKWL